MKLGTIIACLLICCMCFGQENRWEIGLLGNHSKTRVENFSDTLNGHNTLGLFVNYHLTRRSKISVGTNYHNLKMKVDRTNFTPIIDGPPTFEKLESIDEYTILHFPVQYMFQLNKPGKSAFESNLLLGYTYGRIQNFQDKREEYRLTDLSKNIHYLTVGMEFSYIMFQKLALTISPRIVFTNVLDEFYGKTTLFELNFKTGFRI